MTRLRELATAATSAQNCQFGNLGRNALRGPNFFWSDFYITKWFPLSERVKLRFDAQFFNVFNHPNFALPSMVLAGIPGKPSTQTGFGALTYTTSPPTGLAWSRIGRRQQSPDDRVSGAIGVLSRGRQFAGNPYRDVVSPPDSQGHQLENSLRIGQFFKAMLGCVRMTVRPETIRQCIFYMRADARTLND